MFLLAERVRVVPQRSRVVPSYAMCPMAMDVGVTSHLGTLFPDCSTHFNRHKGHMLPMVVVIVPVGVTNLHTFHADFGSMCPMAV